MCGLLTPHLPNLITTILSLNVDIVAQITQLLPQFTLLPSGGK